MSKSRTQNAKLNIAFALVLQIVTFFRGLILPRIIIPAYGSDVNGLISSITQFLTYISLLEAGVGSIFRTSLYKPLANGDIDGVSGIINEQKRFYRKIGFIFVFYVIALCFVYPLIAKTEIDKFYIVTCILILSISTFAEYFISLPYVSLLSADQKVRISYIVSIIYTIVNIFVALFWVALKADLRFIYLSMCIIGLLRPLFYILYVKKHYALNKKAPCNKEALNQRWNGIVHHFAFYVHTNTDSTILTLCISTAAVSVYNVYNAIVCGIYGVVLSVSNSIAAGLGNLLVTGDKEPINRTVDSFELVQGGLTTVLYTITALTLIPFVRIYTAQMTDMQYIQPLFGYIMVAAGAIYCFRCIYSTMSLNANKYKETQLGAVLECVVNLVLSLVLVLVANMGLVGIAIGTAMGMLVRYIFEVVFLAKNVVYRSVSKSLKMIAVSIGISTLSILLCQRIIDYSSIVTFGSWIFYAFISTVITASISVIFYFMFYKATFTNVLCRAFKKKSREKR